jgi:ribosomal RNA-processing protein 8
VEVLARRGFVLKDDTAVDLSNKMFVKMEFVKAAPAVVGKNVQAAEREKEEGTGGNWKMKQTKAKFLDNVKEVPVEDEAKVLKPCLYKVR